MILVGMTPDMMDMLIRMGVTQRIAKRDLFPTQPDWFDALNEAIASAAQIAGEHSCGDDCPMTAYLEKRRHWRHGTSPS
jgi:hypothetical protein